jgi:hypothetical protein
MTEFEWLAATEPAAMLDLLRIGIVRLGDNLPTPEAREAMREHLLGTFAPRKRVLFACACCRRIWDLLRDTRSRNAVEVAERFADEAADGEELEATRAATEDVSEEIGKSRRAEGAYAVHIARLAARAVSAAVRFNLDVTVSEAATVEAFAGISPSLAEANAGLAALLRDICGNPFRPRPTVNPAWLAWNGGAVGRLAETIYQERELPRGHLLTFRVALLADALEDAGCADAQFLGHLRGPGVHWRGCWVVDLLLTKG